MPKTCFRCGQKKSLAAFYRHPRMADGHLGKCKDCTKTDVHVNREKRSEQYRQYEQVRFHKRRAWRMRYQRIVRARSPMRYRARTAVGNAIRDGRLLRQPCVVCAIPKTEAHHARGYRRALDVDWLCRPHHREAHKK